jgi:hypothetical protein
MLRAIADFLYALGRIPGLSFFKDIARPFRDMDRTKRNVENVGKKAKKLKEAVSPDEKTDD